MEILDWKCLAQKIIYKDLIQNSSKSLSDFFG